MYPASYGFGTKYQWDDERDLKHYIVLLCDFVHCVPALSPLYVLNGWVNYIWGLQNAAETLQLPSSKGWDYRIIDGYCYPTIILTTPEEAKQREPIFREKLRPYLENYSGVWEPNKAEMLSVYKTIKSSYGMSKYEDIKKLRNIELATVFENFIRIVNRKEAENHMIMMVPTLYMFGTFQQMWQEVFGVPSGIDPAFSRLMGGIDNLLWRFNLEIWRLGRRAIELGVAPIFEKNDDPEKVIPELEQSDAGRKWMNEYRQFLELNGWRCERMQEWNTPTWIEKPSLGIPSVKVAILTEGTSTLTGHMEQKAKERKEAEKETLSKVPVEQRGWFSLLLKGAQNSCFWNEDHPIILDFQVCAIGRWITREWGRRFTEAGCLDDPEDVYFLMPEEMRKAFIPLERINLRPYAEARKKEWQENLKKQPKPFFGDVERAAEMIAHDPSISVSVQAPIVRPELKADLYGAAAAPGVFEGTARVVMHEKQLSEVKPGDILVAPGTSPTWTAVFEIISAVVADGGGATSHAVIVAREYGIPCVAGCVEATQKIKTGQRIKVDGNLGVVYIL
jgi:pyruvate,water dikinase